MGRCHQLRGIVPKLSERDRRKGVLKRTVSQSHRTTASKVTAELNIHPEDPVSSTTVRQELHKATSMETY
jgi:hypothetical protein